MVLAIYGTIVALAAMALMATSSLVKGNSLHPTFLFSVIIMIYLNVGYFIYGIPASIAFFNGIFDMGINLMDIPEYNLPDGVRRCENCSVLDPNEYDKHSAWAVAFYERFAGDSMEHRKLALYVHIGFNTMAFVIMHVQFWRPGGHKGHNTLGWLCLLFSIIGTAGSCFMASDHYYVDDYGGFNSTLAFYSMATCVLGTALGGILALRRRDMVSHRLWMIRFGGAMWGAFWVMRLLLLVTTPIFIHVPSGPVLTSVFAGSPLGILIAEVGSKRLSAKVAIN